MLARVAARPEAFPRHVAPILTTAVVECSRAGLSATAYDCAAALMRPELKDSIHPSYRRRIEGIVRKRDWCSCRIRCVVFVRWLFAQMLSPWRDCAGQQALQGMWVVMLSGWGAQRRVAVLCQGGGP